MFRLNTLDLSGFKSFVEPVRLDFGAGMTGIVGPNGCGKSNLADAMVWVMGERSAKILRGEKMEDVIFGGSAKRQPVGMAEVYLTLSRYGGDDDDQVAIGRRLLRSGESHYFLNGKRTRLKDVRDLLMDTGLGVRAYSVIEQGRIGTILSGKPQERRRLLEEAAGITHYRERRRLAEIKLEEAQANLERLEDIVAEVERALRSLKRQANAARRYGKRKERYRALRRQVLESRWTELLARRAELAERIAAEQQVEAGATAHVHREEASLAAGREELDRQNRSLTELHRRNADLAASIEGKQEFLKGSRQRLEEIAERVAAGREADKIRRARRDELGGQLAELVARQGELDEQRSQAASEVTEDERRITDVERLVSEEAQRLETLRSSLLASIADHNGLRSRLHREQMDLEKGQLRRRKVEEDLARTRHELDEESQKVAAAGAALEALENAASEAEARLAERKAELAETAAHERGLAATRAETETEHAACERRRDVLTELDRAHRERREHVAQAFADAELGEPEFLADRLRVPKGWEATLDLFFGGLGDAVLVPAGDDALETARELAPGSLTAHLIDLESRAGAPAAAPDDPAIRSSLGQALGLDPALAAALPPAYLVDSPADAVRLAPRHPGIAFIARDRLWAQSGLIHAQGREARPGAFARDHELDEVRRSIPPLAERLQQLADEIASRIAEAASQRRRIEEEERALSATREELAVARARHEDLAARQRRLAIERQTLETEAAELEREIEMVGERTAGLETDLERAAALHEQLETDFDGAQQRLDAARGERETARTSGASRRGRLELAEERLDSHRAELARAEREQREIERQLAAWTDEAERLEERRGEIRQAMEAAESELQEALERRDTAAGEVRGEQQALEAHRARLKEAEAVLESRRAEREAARDRLSELRVGEASLAQDAGHLADGYREEFDSEPPDEPVETEGEIAELEAEMERMRGLLERLGPVNLLAAREYEEQEERHRFLTEQRSDVRRSIERLKETIRDINRTSTERFSATFEQVNEQFKATFSELFQGGLAEMRLLDEDDLLESGIEIVARPPGKRLQNILLLSGGEKALAAIALLFALFKTKPSPFCILDEVDAPLDDLNTLRFVELLKKMSVDTQFIVITHNKITMEAVSTLYGVTMQERGVSSLVSVELDEVQPHREPAVAAAAAG